ncbi:hypothetical protein AC578_451 [Pseudocercospora eumusae]|uniref:Uncharacterized protein n=1 Tax=Pseudocercospora eumusae TaxID=321146 RepID=A0A139HYH7_9PEZI|nr:hypothetical protein AC578_451 [Pseudocercospora eumusae]
MSSLAISPDKGEFKKYDYAPLLPAAVIFIILFSETIRFHHYQRFRSRTWFMSLFYLGGLCKIVGYIGGAIPASEPYGNWTLGPDIMQSVLLLAAPALLSASIYMASGRIVFSIKGEDLLFI